MNNKQYLAAKDVIFLVNIERFSLKCRKTKTEVITLANSRGAEQSIIQSNLEAITRSEGKLARASHDWFLFYLRLVLVLLLIG